MCPLHRGRGCPRDGQRVALKQLFVQGTLPLEAGSNVSMNCRWIEAAGEAWGIVPLLWQRFIAQSCHAFQHSYAIT